jgi:hypothetical protein
MKHIEKKRKTESFLYFFFFETRFQSCQQIMFFTSKKKVDMGAAKKNVKKQTSRVVQKKKALKAKLLKTKKQQKKDVKVTRVIRSGSVFEKLYDFWKQLSTNKRKVLAEVGTALTNNAVEAKRIRVSLLPKVVKPKRPMTSYMLFAHENHERVKTEHPDWKMTQIAQTLGQEWKNLEQQTKDDFKLRKVSNTRAAVSHRMDPKEKARRVTQRTQLRALKQTA